MVTITETTIAETTIAETTIAVIQEVEITTLTVKVKNRQ